MSKKNWAAHIAISALALNGCGDAKESPTAPTEIASKPAVNQKSKEEYIKLIRQNLESCAHFLGEDPYDQERAKSLYKNAETDCSLAKSNADQLILSDPSSKATVGSIYKEYLGESVENVLKSIQKARTYWSSPEAKASFESKELASDADENYGTYSNENVTITYEMGNRGQDIFYSSQCRGQFTPRFEVSGETSMWYGANNDYIIYFNNSHSMEIEGNNNCFPEGRYKKIQ